ncbi:MAG: helix-turn-helix domain-containing protein [Clostridia bacterium]|nr:helix-turn-helix domain-containing protein [Clostridia bacterium]
MSITYPKKEFFPRPLYPALSIDRLYTAMVRDFGGDFIFPGEAHEMWEMSCVLSGAAGITLGTKVYECHKGDVIIIPGGIFHTSWAMNNESVRMLTVSFTGNWVNHFVPAGKFTLTQNEQMIAGVLADRIKDICGMLDPYEVEISREDEQIIKNLIEIIVLSLNIRRDENEKTAAGGANERFTGIAGYMKEHVCDPLDVERICTDCLIGRSALKELFRKYTGSGVMKYYNYLRLRHVIKLLGEGMLMSEIAEIMNFSSQNYLSSFFKRETGMTPSQYRMEKLDRKDGD